MALFGAVIAACASSNSAAPAGGVKCTAGNYVFCRCEDRSEGTKLCRQDGVSFDECKCDGTGGPVTAEDGGLVSTPPETLDSGAPMMGPSIDAKCFGKLGVVAGSDADHATFFATYTAAGLFTASSSKTSPGVRGPVTILPAAGGSLVATYLADYGYAAWTKFSAGTWSAPESLGDGFADHTKATSMSDLSGQLRLLYLGQDAHYHMGTYGAAGWDIGFTAGVLAEPGGDAGAAVPGKSAPASAVVGSSITLAFTGNDGSLDRETYSSGSWASITKFPGATAYPMAPAIAAIDSASGVTKDMLMVYSGSDLLMHVATRTASNKVWNAPILFDTAASSSDIAMIGLPNGKAMLVYKASNGQGYYSVWAEGTGFGPPAELVAGKNPEIAAVPGLTRTRCGSGDATIAYAQKADGLVKILRFSGTTMSGPFDVGGITKVTHVGVGELP